MKYITDADYTYAKIGFKDFEIKRLGEHQDLHVQSNRLLLTDIFEKFRNICLKFTNLVLQFFFSFWSSIANSFKKD